MYLFNGSWITNDLNYGILTRKLLWLWNIHLMESWVSCDIDIWQGLECIFNESWNDFFTCDSPILLKEEYDSFVVTLTWTILLLLAR